MLYLLKFWKLAPLTSAAMVGGVITMMTAWPKKVQAWEDAHPKTMRATGILMALVVVMGAVSAFQQQNETATKVDLAAAEARVEDFSLGGDSHPFLTTTVDYGTDNDTVFFFVNNSGTVPLRGIAVEITEIGGTYQTYEVVGDIGSQDSHRLATRMQIFASEFSRRLKIGFKSLNGPPTQTLCFGREKGELLVASRLVLKDNKKIDNIPENFPSKLIKACFE